MHFLPDVWVPCEECDSKRYKEEVLEIKFHGRSIADVLAMQCGEAVELFADHTKLRGILQTLCDVGLDYVTLGQSAPTLSGGEAQRVKLASELARPVTGNTLYLLDEPTTGLHFDDIAKLLQVLQRLVELGNTMVVIEHNLDVIKCADWVVDLGPGAGVHGGEIVFAGKPEDLAATAKYGKPTKAHRAKARSTADFLAPILGTDITKKTEPASGKKIRVEPSQKSKPPRKAPAKKRQTVSAATAKKRSNANDPWQVLGRRWHTLSKGFPEGTAPQWPLELADRVLTLLQQIAGDDSLAFEDPTRVDVRPFGKGETWAAVETKEPDSLKLTLSGPTGSIDPDRLASLDIDAPIDASRDDEVRVTLNMTDLKHIRSRKIRTFLKDHLALAFAR